MLSEIEGAGCVQEIERLDLPREGGDEKRLVRLMQKLGYLLVKRGVVEVLAAGQNAEDQEIAHRVGGALP
jgi:hypothetical protein